MRIGISGSGGSGKSVLCSLFAARTGVPFKAAKTITGDILKRDGYDYRLQVQVERFLASSHRQHEILQRTQEAQRPDQSFIVDRTFVDLAAYALCEMHNSDPKELSVILDACRQGMAVYTHVFLCPWAGIDLRRSNERRTLNPHYQLLIHEVIVGLLTDWGIPFHWLRGKDADSRVLEVAKALTESGFEVGFKDAVELPRETDDRD